MDNQQSEMEGRAAGFCPKCGAAAEADAAFCRKCGALVSQPAPPVATVPVPVPIVNQTRFITRVYHTEAGARADGASMSRAGWFLHEGGQYGKQWRAVYGTNAPPGQALLPDPLWDQPPRSPRVGLFIGAGVALLVLCAIIGVFANSGSSSAGGSSQSADGRPTVAPPSKYAASPIDPRLLASDPASYIGSNVYIQGKALTVDQQPDYTWVQIQAQIPNKSQFDTQSVVVELKPKISLLSGDCYRIYGIGAGTQKVTRTLTGASNNAPLLAGYAADRATATEYGCAAP